MRIADFLALSWSEPGKPLIEPPLFSPIIADPSFLFPEEAPASAPDSATVGDWELFAHSAWGVHRYSSPDGLSWRDRGIVARNAMRPFIRRLTPASTLHGSTGADARYALYFETYPPLALPFSSLPVKRPWKSRIAMAESSDLGKWSAPRTLIEPTLPWMSDPKLGASVSNPCLIPIGRGGAGIGGSRGAAGSPAEAWRLYFSASLAWIPDCGFCEPRYLAAAESESPKGPFQPLPAPMLDPEDDPLPGVLGAGSIKVLPMEDGCIGLQNKIYRDPRGASRSAIFILRSEDGLAWSPAREAPLLAPSPTGWTSSHVYACDCRFRESDGLWYLYFNARDGWRISEGRERIGRIVGCRCL